MMDFSYIKSVAGKETEGYLTAEDHETAAIALYNLHRVHGKPGWPILIEFKKPNEKKIKISKDGTMEEIK